MTLVIGAISGDDVYLAGDSYCGDLANDVVDLCKDPKVYMVSNTVALGICGGIRTEVAVVKAIKSILSAKKKVVEQFLLNDFSTKLHEKLKDTGILKDIKGVHSLDDSEYILAHAGRLYYLDDDMGLWESQTPYVAIGAARSIALGSLAYAHKTGELQRDPVKVLERVLECAARHSHYVRPPYTYLEV